MSVKKYRQTSGHLRSCRDTPKKCWSFVGLCSHLAPRQLQHKAVVLVQTNQFDSKRKQKNLGNIDLFYPNPYPSVQLAACGPGLLLLDSPHERTPLGLAGWLLPKPKQDWICLAPFDRSHGIFVFCSQDCILSTSHFCGFTGCNDLERTRLRTSCYQIQFEMDSPLLPFNFIQLQWPRGNMVPVCRLPWWSKSLSFGSAAVAIFATSSRARSNEAD